MHLVQILLPVFNSEKYLGESINSLLQQTYSNFELIILDDGSTDKSLGIIEKFASLDNRISLISHKNNQGIIASRNDLIIAASTTLIAFADSDDIYLPDRIGLQVKFLNENPNITAVSGGHHFIGEQQGVFIPPQSSQEINAHLSLVNVFSNPAAMVRRDKLLEHNIFCDKNYRGAADFLMWKLLSQKENLANIPEVLFYYRTHTQQESTLNSLRQEKNHLRVVNKYLSKYNLENEDNQHLKPLIWPQKYGNSENLLQVGKYVSAVTTKFFTLGNQYSHYIKFWDIRFRSLCRMQGSYGLICYIKVFGFKKLMTGKNLGLSFIKACLTQNIRN